MTIAARITTILRDVRDTRRLKRVLAARRLLESRGYVVSFASTEATVDAITMKAMNELRLEVARLKAALDVADNNARRLARRNADLESWMRAATAGVSA